MNQNITSMTMYCMLHLTKGPNGTRIAVKIECGGDFETHARQITNHLTNLENILNADGQRIIKSKIITKADYDKFVQRYSDANPNDNPTIQI